jgi:hypothetical protein
LFSRHTTSPVRAGLNAVAPFPALEESAVRPPHLDSTIAPPYPSATAAMSGKERFLAPDLLSKNMKSELKTRDLKDLSAAYLAKDLRVNPEYQRGLQWGLAQKQGLIDSLLRGYQIPIFYIHLEKRTEKLCQAEMKRGVCVYTA